MPLNFGNAVGVSIDEDEESIALQALNKFLESPQSIGLDSLKESLRNIVQLMMELKGFATGFSLQHLVHGEHSSMAFDGALRDDAQKKRLIKEFWDEMLRFEREMAARFAQVFEHVATQIVEIKEDLADEIERIDANIEDVADTVEEARVLKAQHTKRKKLVKFKKHIEKHEVELQEADTTQEIVEIQSDVMEDVQDFKLNRFDHRKGKLDLFAPIRELETAIRSGYDRGVDYGFDLHDDDFYASDSANDKAKRNKSGDSDTGSGSSGDDTSGSGDDTTGSGDRDEDAKPPPVSFDF